MKVILKISLFFLLGPSGAGAFVENVVHGYPNCMACHIAPSGGGVLTDYGRSLSKELMTTWGWKSSEEPLFGAVKNLEWLKIGGDARYLQTYFENADVKQGRQFLMQQNIELALQAGKISFVGTLGTQEGPAGTPNKGEFLSERHFFLWETSENSRLRFSKFRVNYGLYDPNHTRTTKPPIGFGSNSETYNLEFSKFTEGDEIFLTTSLGRLDLPHDTTSERSVLLTYAAYVAGNSKFGVSLLTGESRTSRRNLGGVFGLFPFWKDGVIKFESDFQRSNLASAPETSTDLSTTFASASWQVATGIMPYLFVEYLQSDLSDPRSSQVSPGLGLQWLPIPHFEFQAEYRRQTLQLAPDKPNNIGWLLAHIYL